MTMMPASSYLMSWLASISPFQAITILVLALVAIPTVRFIRGLIRSYFSPLRALPGPEGEFLFGNYKDMRDFDVGVWHEQMIEKYGPVMAFKGFFGVSTSTLIQLLG